MTLNVGDILVNRYRIVKLVGQGGFGAVYRAWDLSLKVPVAVKENLDTTAEAQHQFEQEAQLLAPLRHPNLPRVSDHFFVPGQGQYLVMDFIEGQSLAEVVAARGGPLSEAEALAWISQVCDALEYLHTRTPPIIHRDIKPQNIIITAEGRAVLVDFGISKAYDPQLTTTRGARAVTPGYSPPEQYGMGKTDARSDVYALGATLYTLLTGQTPPESVTLMAGGESLLAIRRVNPMVNTLTESAVAAAMALATSQRLQNATALKNALAGRAIAPLPALGQTVAAAAQPAQRRGLPAWLLAAGGLAALAIIAIGIYLWWQGRQTGVVPTPVAPQTVAPERTLTTEVSIVAAVGEGETTEPVVPTAQQEPPPATTPEQIKVATPATPAAAGDRRTVTLPSGVEVVRLLVPGGTFQMGSATNQGEERPVHEVQLDSFWIDQTPVTNAQFEAYVNAVGLQTRAERSNTGQVLTADSWQPLEGANWRSPQGPSSGIADKRNHPVVLVTWEEARDYCAWSGGRLPTEAEWEYAARGPENLPYPWGRVFDPAVLNYCDRNCPFEWRNSNVDDGFAFTSPVDAFPQGASWVGAYDMLGNVWEWVQDWYDADYYDESPAQNPTGPESGALRVARGGGWPYEAGVQYAANRARGFPTDAYNGFGFRCAEDGDSAAATKTAEPTARATERPRAAATPADRRVAVLPGGVESAQVLVPAGAFRMGADDEDSDDDEAPIHEVRLDAFWLDVTEVTNAQYAAFVEDTGYVTDDELDGVGYTVLTNSFEDVPGADWEHPQGPGSTIVGQEDRPVILVSWDDARAYCVWAGGRLPTEAEWEYAARGPQATTYPWGNTFSDSRVNSCDRDCPMDWDNADADDGYVFSAPVGTFAGGRSWVGAEDMAGNVWEWTADWYDEDYYARSPVDNPTGPTGSVDEGGRSVRGGAWSSTVQGVRSAVRVSVGGWRGHFDVGFRCAYDATSSQSNSIRPTLISNTVTSPARDIASVSVPGGSFVRGSTADDPGAYDDESPQRVIELDAFRIARTETTNRAYAACVAAGACEPPRSARSRTRQRYYGAGEFDEFPVVNVTWENANAFCAWAGGRLPTEAEWEKAARGANGAAYPWGDDAPTCALANFNNCAGDTTEVGAYSNGASPYGALDMAGNVWEWVADWYGSDYYASAPDANPRGPSSGEGRVFRGGAWDDAAGLLRGAYRDAYLDRSFDLAFVGFRCAFNATPQS